MLMGSNRNKDVILSLIDLKSNDIERFRDVDIGEDGISITTRTGGGNREDYPNEILTSNPNYLRDEDDDFDSTYAYYYFKFPDELKDDIILFLDTAKNGIPASIVNKFLSFLNRPETPSDKYTRIYEAHMACYRSLAIQLKVFETNGHTIVPLSDSAMACLLDVSEKNDIEGREGEFLPYNLRPYILEIKTDVPEYDKSRINLLKIEVKNPWKIDLARWERYKILFEEKYPKAISFLKKQIEKGK